MLGYRRRKDIIVHFFLIDSHVKCLALLVGMLSMWFSAVCVRGDNKGNDDVEILKEVILIIIATGNWAVAKSVEIKTPHKAITIE